MFLHSCCVCVGPAYHCVEQSALAGALRAHNGHHLVGAPNVVQLAGSKEGLDDILLKCAIPVDDLAGHRHVATRHRKSADLFVMYVVSLCR